MQSMSNMCEPVRTTGFVAGISIVEPLAWADDIDADQELLSKPAWWNVVFPGRKF